MNNDIASYYAKVDRGEHYTLEQMPPGERAAYARGFSDGTKHEGGRLANGWQLVPKIPTIAMCEMLSEISIHQDGPATVWRNTLAASPEAPKP